MDKPFMNPLLMNIPIPNRKYDPKSALSNLPSQGQSFMNDGIFQKITRGLDQHGKACTRFTNLDLKKQEIHDHDVASYLALRKQNFPKKDALHWVGSPKCRIDISSESTGPTADRHRFKLMFNRFEGQNGWLFAQLAHYDIENDYPENMRTLRRDEFRADFERFCKIYGREIYDGERHEKELMQRYANDIQQSVRLGGLSRLQLKQKIQQKTNDYEQLRAKYLQIGSKQYPALAQALPQDYGQSETVLQKLKLFKQPFDNLAANIEVKLMKREDSQKQYQSQIFSDHPNKELLLHQIPRVASQSKALSLCLDESQIDPLLNDSLEDQDDQQVETHKQGKKLLGSEEKNRNGRPLTDEGRNLLQSRSSSMNDVTQQHFERFNSIYSRQSERSEVEKIEPDNKKQAARLVSQYLKKDEEERKQNYSKIKSYYQKKISLQSEDLAKKIDLQRLDALTKKVEDEKTKFIQKSMQKNQSHRSQNASMHSSSVHSLNNTTAFYQEQAISPRHLFKPKVTKKRNDIII